MDKQDIMISADINIIISRALEGDKKALNELVKSMERMVYNLSIKMLWDPEDAKDASQEILIKVITRLESFRHESSFATWVYRIATNYLLTNLSEGNKRRAMSFDEFALDLKEGMTSAVNYVENEGEQNMLVQEIKIGCSNGMLQCLDKDSRATYILGDILGFNSQEGASIQDISPESFRKRLSRARELLFRFMEINCGIAQPRNSCRCKKQINHCTTTGRVNRRKLMFATNGEDVVLLESINHAENAVKLFKSNPDYELPDETAGEIRRILMVQ